ncbi:hypothetical protein MNBD_ALPHA09-691 [hydrothermal vent metagenome]|uniref:Uncharacterized protein n=1 Tax=hydrothermal vent metagenome TaxID=652676 RepID=A0A3B0TDD9_9ZZZZ
MRDENNTKGQGRDRKTAKAADQPGQNVAENGDFDAGSPDLSGDQAGGVNFHAAQMPPIAQPVTHLPPAGMQLGDTLDEIPGFLRRCATETSAHDRFPDANENSSHDEVSPDEFGNQRTGGDRGGKAGGHHSGSAGDGDFGAGFPAGSDARGARGEAAPARDREEQSGWSNTARGALNELLADIDDEQARRISNRDQFAALAGKRRTTWPLTALIVSFLLVVLAYSARNVDASGAPGTVWRGAWALLVGPREENPPPQNQVSSLVETKAPVAAAAAQYPPAAIPQAPAPVVRQPAPQPVAPVKTTGLIFEPVKIVDPYGNTQRRVEPVRQQNTGVAVASLNPPAVAPPVAPATPETLARSNTAVPASPATVAASAPLAPSPTSTTTALAPSMPASPDKMPLASLAVSETAFVPSRNIAPAPELRRVASVAPDIIGGRADARPAEADTATINLAARPPQPRSVQPSLVPAAPDIDGTKAMLTRADSLLEARDLASARLLFMRAARYGSAAGAFGAARTYDPVSFQQMGVYGVPAEPDKAIALYQKAIDAGHVEAVKYLGNLNAWLKSTQGRTSTAQR